MGDSWQMKRLPPWRLSKSISPAPLPLTPVLPPQSPIAPAAQMDANRCNKFYSFFPWEGNLEDDSINQDTMSHQSFSIPCASRRTEMRNTFLNFLPGPPLPQPYSYKPRGPRVGSVTGATDDSPVFSTGLMAASENHVNERLGKNFCADERGSSVSSSNCRNGIQTPMLNIFSHDKKELEPRNSVSSRGSSFIRGCPRVFCLGKVGELFVSDDGLLGVYCLCHNLRMSVAKFCEHSGLYAVNPGNAVLLENGETVAQWRRLFFLNLGVNVPDDTSGWDWTNVASAAGFFDRSKVDTLSSSKNSITYQPHQPFEEVEKPDVLPNILRSHYPVEECSTWQTSQRNFENTKQKYDMDSTQCVPSWFVNQTISKQVKEYEQELAYTMSNFGYTIEGQNCVVSEKVSPLNPDCDLEKTFVGDPNDSKFGNTRVDPFTDWDSALSSVELRLGQPSQQNQRLTMSAALCQQQNHSITSEHLKRKLLKLSAETFSIPSEFSSSIEGLWHQMQNPEKQYRRQADNLGGDCDPVIPFMASHVSAMKGEIKPCPVSKVIGKNHNLGFSNLSTNVCAANKRASYHGRNGPFVSPDDDFFVMKQCTLFEHKSDKEHRAPSEPINFLSNEQKSFLCQSKHNSFHPSGNRAFEDSDRWKESDSWSRTAKASFIFPSPKNSFLSSNTVTASTPMSSSSKGISLVKTQLFKGNSPNFPLGQKMNIEKSPFCYSVEEMPRNMSDEVHIVSKDYIQKNSSVTCRLPNSFCEYSSSDLPSSLYVETGLSDIIQGDSLCSSETRGRYPVSHAYKNIPSISRLCRTESQATERADSRFLCQVDERLVHSKRSQEQITEQNIALKVCNKDHNTFPPSYCTNKLTPASRDIMLSEYCDSLSRHDKDVFIESFRKSNPITAVSTNNQLTGARDNIRNGYYHGTLSSNEEKLYHTCPRYSAHLMADLSVEDNNLDCNLVLDEASVAEKCGSSDDVLENGQRAKYGSCNSSGFNANDENDICPSEFTFHKKPTKEKKVDNIHPESTCKPISEPAVKKKKKKKRAPKWRKLDDSFPTSGAVNMISPICDKKMKNSTDEAELSVNFGILKKTLGLKNKRHFNCCNHKKSKTAKNLVSHNTEDTEEQDTSDKQSGVPPVDGISYRDRLSKPVVHGPYGIIWDNIMHGKPKPVKIVSLSSLLKATKGCSITRNADQNDDFEKTEMKFNTKLSPKAKETRKRKLSDMMGNSKEEICTPNVPVTSCNHSVNYNQLSSTGRVADNSVDQHLPQKKNQERLTSDVCYVTTDYQCGQKPSKNCPTSLRKVTDRDYESDAFCCVCRSSKKENDNSLLECSNCSIKVHQACYGIAKIPKGRWSCRPCRSNSKDIACVLCGYGGGAMTRALRSRNIVKDLLKAWKDDKPSKSSSEVQNSITAGSCNPKVIQWIHMVCGLWTPGTRCPNVNTMNAFDVSGVSRLTMKMVCSICNREGGSLINCRIVDCSVQFHPWCAHQKGLLQCETEGIDDESVGFYGRCLLHATYHSCLPGSASPRVKDFSCARIEVFKCRERPVEGNGFVVPAEQVNTWIQVNKRKSNGPEKPVPTENDSDCKEAYAHYKLRKGWRQLMVYKSRIHGLGLYTSQFIPRGGVVVEYVGEIVGSRVADKREAEYQSGKRLQYKSACYFFRIDRESIIDATMKGGIARFVNHSCLPNCVAKVIAAGNDKKVVFFAERDIRPGEEITYDYNFNREEEGSKIPCFCNSKNCRRYLN